MEYKLEGTLGGSLQVWELHAECTTIGRDRENDITIPDRTVSRRHAEIRIEEDRISVSDLGSHNGTWVDGQRIVSPVILQPGASIRFGNVEMRLTAPDMPAELARQDTAPGGAGLGAATAFLTPDKDFASTSVSWETVRRGLTGGSYLERSLFRLITEAGQILATPHPLEEVFRIVLDLVADVIRVRRVLLVLREGAEGEPVVRAVWPQNLTSRDLMVRVRDSGEQLMLSRTMMDAVLNGRESLLVTDAQSDPRFLASESIVAQNVQSALVAPLFDNEKVIGLIYADTNNPMLRFDPDQLRAFTMLANLIGVKITNTKLLESQREKERLEAEMDTGCRIQRSLLPAVLPEVEGYEMFAHQSACDHVAGDLYDAAVLPDGRIALVLGDVSGKGLGAALLMSHVMACLRLLYEDPIPVSEMMTRIHRQILRSSGPTHFVTLFIGILDPENHRIEFVNAGHNPPFLIERGGAHSTLDTTGMPAGLIDIATYGETTTVDVPPGGLLCIYSDGITEAPSPEDDLFGEDRLLESLLARRHAPLEQVLSGLLEDVDRFQKGTPAGDDITLLFLRRRIAP